MFWGKKREEGKEDPRKGMDERRRYFRLAKQLNVRLFDSQRRQFTFFTKDISAGGLRLAGGQAFPAGTYLVVHLQLEPARKPMQIMSRVIWAKKGEDQRVFELGVEFVDITEADRDSIVKYVNTELLRLRRDGIV